jgi:toxin FitB
VSFLLDTNVVSELRKVKAGKADRNVAAWAENISPADLYLSSVTILELETGVLLMERRDKSQGAILRAWLSEHVMPAFSGRIIIVDTEIALRSARLQVPDPKPLYDTLIAATALIHRMTIVTRNLRDFEQSEAPTFNPWLPKAPSPRR